MKYWYSRWNTGILDDILVFPLKAENLFRKAQVFFARAVCSPSSSAKMQKETSDLGEHRSGSSSGPAIVHRAIVAGNKRRSILVHTPSAQSVSSAQSPKYDYEPSPLLHFQGVSGLEGVSCENKNDLLSRPNTAGLDELMPSHIALR